MKKILLLVFLLTVGTANAGILLEPYLGYSIGGISNENNTADYNYKAPTFGARVGYQMLGFMGGLEYNILSPSWEDQVPPTDLDHDMKNTNMGLFVGFNFPIMLRVWGTYYFNAKTEDNEGTDIGDFYSGNGQVLGVGFTGLPLVSLNLEYKKFSYDEYETVAGVVTPLNGNDKVGATEIVLSVSLPFELPL